MNCGCGNVVEDNSTCTKCGSIHENCGACGGQVIAMPKTMILSCPYCDTPLHQIDVGETPYFPINFTRQEIETQLNRFLLNRFGIPDDFSANRTVLDSTLAFIPIKLFRVQAFLNETIFEVDTKAIILNPTLWYLSKIQEYRFAVRVKQVMQKEEIESKVYPITIPDDHAELMVEPFGKSLLENDRNRFKEVPSNPKVTTEAQGNVFYPLYELTYEYRGKEYRAVLDASNGVVCFAEYPMCSKSRASVGITGVMMFVVTLVLTAVFSQYGEYTKLASTVVFCMGSLASANILWMAMRSHSVQESCAPDTEWDAQRTYGEMSIENRKVLSTPKTIEST